MGKRRPKTAEQEMAAVCLASRVRVLNRVISGLFDEQLRPHGLRASQLNILVVVAARGPLSPTEVCRRMKLEKSTLSRDIERLVDSRWVRVIPAEGRGQQIEITEQGRRLIARVKPAWAKAQGAAEKLLGPALSGELVRTVDDWRRENQE